MSFWWAMASVISLMALVHVYNLKLMDDIKELMKELE